MSKSRSILLVAGVVIALPLIALASLPFLLNANDFRPTLAAQLQKSLRRPVSLGEMTLKTFPLTLAISDLSIGQPDGFPLARPFVQAKQVSVGIALWPLLRKEVSIETVRLASPRIELIRNKAGAWDYDSLTSAPSDGSSSSSSLTLDNLAIEDGSVAFDDQKAGTPRDVYEHINLAVKGVGPNRKGSAEVSMRLETSAAMLKLQSDFDTTGGGLAAKGNLTLASDRNKDPLNVVYSVKRASPGGPIAIEAFEAKIGSLSASATGTIDPRTAPAALQLHFKSASAPIADLMRLAALYGAKFPGDLKVEGAVQADVQISGTSEKPLLAGRIEATKAQISAKQLAEPVRASELIVDFTPGTLTTHPFTLETGATKLAVQATVGDYATDIPRVAATVQTTGARVEELLRMASAYGVKPVGLEGSGTVTLDLKLTQVGKTLGYSGSGSLRGVSLTSPDLPKALTVSTADLKFTDDRAGLENLQAGLGSMHMTGSMAVRNFARPDLQFNLHLDQVNVDELSAAKSAEKNAPSSASAGNNAKASAAAPPNLTAKGAVAIDKVLYGQTTLTNVKASIDYSGGILKMDPVTAAVFGGQEAGAITADLRNPTTAYAIKSRLTAVDSGQLLAATSSVKGFVSGPLTGNFDIHFQAKPNDNIAATLSGLVTMQMGPGRLSGVAILNQLASIGRFAGVTGKQEAYTNINKVSGTLNITNGVATTTDLLVDLGGGNLTGAGTMGLVDQALNLKVTATLTKDYMQKNGIAQVGGLLTTVLSSPKGDLVVPAIVSGTFAQPKFTPDGAAMAKLKLQGLTGNPAGVAAGIKDLLGGLKGKPQTADPNSPQDSSQPQPQQNGLGNLLNRLKKK